MSRWSSCTIRPPGTRLPWRASSTPSPERVAGKGIQDVVQRYAGIIGGLPAKPVVIGHSFGGLIVQRLLGQDLAVAGVAIDPAGRLQRRHVVLRVPLRGGDEVRR